MHPATSRVDSAARDCAVNIIKMTADTIAGYIKNGGGAPVRYAAITFKFLQGRRVVVFGHDSMGMETVLACTHHPHEKHLRD